MEKTILEVNNLHTTFYTHLGNVQAVRGISFTIREGDIMGIVGESGSGKSVTAMSIMGLVDEPGKVSDGSVRFGNLILNELSDKDMTKIRGKEISMIFQDPMTSLNPVYSIGNQLIEVIRTHTDISYNDARLKALDLLKLVGIPDPEVRIKQYPHQFSGGMRQRAMIAMAISCNPKLLIADEPTTALDVTIQAQILDLMMSLKQKIDTSIILITHDLGVISEICTKVVVMYGGMAMEKADVIDLFDDPQHPYTRGLLKSIPKNFKGVKERLIPIDGTPPDLLNPPSGCPFSPRCPHTMGICLKEASPLYKISDNHYASCWLHNIEAPTVAGFKKSQEVEE
ncbi:MAG: ABC transporter ATP-binding protein [Candidatus Izemoplasmatales bacterium]|jgi:oligopeptide transport system ATP-binding protein|nr:ABC transporter ATP-binding protein [Candidatus Izemoplasmatales bacterium]MDD3865769.1 ABC transporter ATP-binding protein [Candidatus Izemoplasmatales bacterium]